MVRIYKRSDAKGIADLLNSAGNRTVFHGEIAKADSLERNLGQLAELEQGTVFVAERSGRISGVLAAIQYNRPWNEEYSVAEDLLFVAEGSGRELLRVYKDWAAARGVKQVITHCSSGDPRTDKWYKAMGAKKLGSIWEV